MAGGRGELTGQPAAAAQAPSSVLVCQVGARRVGLLTADVREVLQACAVETLPNAPPFLLGLLNFHGLVLPAFDLAARLTGQGRPPRHTDHFVVVRAIGREVVLCVHRALEITLASVRPPPELVGAAPGVAGVAESPDGLLVVWDLPSFLSIPEQQELDSALRAPRA